MQFPRLEEVARYREMTSVFGGYNHKLSCGDGQFFEMKNMTSKYFPILSPRDERGIVKRLKNPQGVLDKEELWWIDSESLYKNGVKQELKNVTLSTSPKTMAKMGAYIIIMPDKVWINTSKTADEGGLECGYIENFVTIEKGESITFSICDEKGNAIDWKDADYYKSNEPKDGDYMLSVNSNGKPSLKVYAGSTSIWLTVASTYMQIKATGIGKGFEKEDGIKITSTYNGDSLDNIFVNTEEDGKHYSTNTYVVDRTDDIITIPGIYNGKIEAFTDIELEVERSMPELSFVTECNNRVWGCSTDGHEIYCSKLGDLKNWNCFRGVSTDSWAATIGSDGKFTGAITYGGYPIFFKEDGLVKVAVSSIGAHQTKETKCRGVQEGSHQSLCILNEVLYYKSTTEVCSYNGSLPYSISESFGDKRYYDAVAGSVGDKYYLSVRDETNEYSMFAYDTLNGIWCKEDDTKALFFCKHKDDLYLIDAKDNTLKSVGGSFPFDTKQNKEGRFDWCVESGVIGYSTPDNKYVSKINLRITLEFGTNVDFLIQYDSCGEWEHKFNMSGTGTRTYSVPIIPKRCDHFRYKIQGTGGCKIHSITKTIEEGSDE